MRYTFLITVLVVLLIAVTFITFHGIMLNNEQYDRLKGVVLKWPGILTFLGAVIAIFPVPYGEETITLVAAIGAFMSYCLGVSNKQFVEGAAYYEGDTNLEDGDDVE